MREQLERELASYPFFLGTGDVENFLGISHSTLNTLINEGQIKAFRSGKKIFKIPKSSLIDYILERIS